MKKTLIALLAISGTAMAELKDAVWTFENTLAPKTNPDSSLQYEYIDVNVTGQTPSPTYTDSNLKKGAVFGDYELTQDMGKAITLTDGQYIKMKNVAYWANGNGMLAIGQDAPNSYTLMTWVNLTSTSGEVYLFGTGDSNGSGLAFVLNNNKIDLLAKSKAHHDITSALTLSTGTWYNFAITYDSSTGKAVAYINGVETATLTGLNGSGMFNNPGGQCSYIGAGSTHRDQDTFAGSMAEFQILNGALTQEQVLAAAHLTKVTPVPEPTTGTLSLLALAGLCARRRKK